MRPRQQERWHERRACEEVECPAFQARDLAKFEGREARIILDYEVLNTTAYMAHRQTD